MKTITTIFILLLSSFIQPENEFCGVRNTSFEAGEDITMKVYYNTLGVYVAAGEANFTTSLTRFNNKPVYHVVATGTTYSFFDKFFRIRDKYETFIDTE